MSDSILSGRVASIRSVIAERQRAGGWTHPVQIVAVTKTHGPDAVRAAVNACLDAVGENRVQEALTKQESCADLAVEWHLIGTLQRNKVRQIGGRFALIHSVDRSELAEEINQRVPGEREQAILIQVNCSGESQKGGIEPDELEGSLANMRSSSRLAVRGLMTMAALSDDESVPRRAFAMLRALRDRMQLRGFALPQLSMGMSGDYGIAVEEGATIVRLGTALFGRRP